MGQFGSEPTRAFNPAQKFLVLDVSTGTASLVLGQDLLDYITPNLDAVRTNTTRAAAQNEDYETGTFVQVAGGTAIDDGAGGMFLVVAAGEGDFPMLNGNELLLLPFGSLAGSNLDGGLVTDDGEQITIQTAIAKRGVEFPDLETFRVSEATYDFVTILSALENGNKGRMELYRTGDTGTPTTAGNKFSDLSAGIFCNAAGVEYALSIDQMITPYTFGAVGDGATSDLVASQLAVGSNFTGTSKGRAVIIPPESAFLLDGTLEIPPNVYLVGGSIYSTNLSSGRFMISHDGVGVRFVRRNASPGSLWHMGGAYKVAFSTTAGGGSSTKLVELGDSSDVTTSTGCWSPIIEKCLFSYCTSGYGIYSAHSQEARILNNTFRSVKYPIYYNTVIASARIENNTLLDESAISGAVAIFMRQGSLGGSSGATITGNYSIGFETFLWGVSVHGVNVYSNQIEGCRRNNVYLTQYLMNESTQDGDGCYGWDITGNTFINFAAAGLGHTAVQLNFSHDNVVGKNTYQSPNASAGSCVGMYDNATGATQDNEIYIPTVTGVNTSVAPLPSASSVTVQNAYRGPDFYQPRVQLKAALPSAAYKGRIIYVDDETGGSVLAFSDGTNWRRVTDRAIVS